MILYEIISGFWLVVLVLSIVYYVCDGVRFVNLPPGPRWLPFIGSYILFQKIRQKCGYNHLAFMELSKIYGPIYSMKFGREKCVVVSTHKLVKKFLLQDNFNGRQNGFFHLVRSMGTKKGVLFTEGQMWTKNRSYVMKHLKSFGLGRATMENNLILEARSLIKYLWELNKVGPVPMHRVFDIAVLNILWTMIAGHRFNHKDQRLHDILEVVHDSFRLTDSLGGLVTHMPFLRFLIPEWSGYNRLKHNSQEFWKFIEYEIDNHEKDFNEDQPRDLIDTFLQEIKNRKGSNDDSEIFNRENLIMVCLDLFLAGSKTTSDILVRIFSFLSVNPEWMKILQDDLDQVVGKDRSPSLEDRSFLPRVEAFLSEAQRFLVIAPLGIPHKAMKDTSLENYYIPKDTTILLNYHSVFNDEAYWERPEEFHPERFLSENGEFQASKTAMIFGYGKRRCLGEVMARSSLFLFFTYLIHHFNFEITPEHGPPDQNGYDGFTISSKPYYLKLSLRSRLSQFEFES